MKLTAILLLSVCLQAAATGYGQLITLKVRNAPLEEVFREIRRQTGYDFVVNNDLLAQSKPVTLSISSTRISEVLYSCLAGQPLQYAVDEKVIIVTAKATVLGGNLFNQPPIKVNGRVSNEKGEGIPNVTIQVKGSSKTTQTDERGMFTLTNVEDNAVLIISSIAYESKEIGIAGRTDLAIQLQLSVKNLEEFSVPYSNGYQNIPKERATGSFVQIDNELFNREVGTNVLSRLDGITNAMYVNKRNGGNTINIRGINSISDGVLGALVIVDNFPYAGSLNSINPNDVETISVLKDAAATSAWGARAGNGVIVITLKKGRFNQPLRLSVNANKTITQKPDLSYNPVMTSSEFIDVEQMLYSKDFYKNDLLATNNNRPVISPIVNILDKQQKMLITPDEAIRQINKLRGLDYRNDLAKYFYRKGINQQYAINLSGGSQIMNYMLSIGYDKNLGSQIGNNTQRYTLRYVNIFRPVKSLEIKASILYTQSGTQTNGFAGNYPVNVGGGKSYLYPYASLTDNNGNALSVAKDYNTNYTDTAGGGKLLDWSYRPLDELKSADNNSKSQDVSVGITGKYNIINGLSAEVIYNYTRQTSSTRRYYSQQTYFTRNLINRFTQINGTTVKRIIPLGGILDLSNGEINNNNVRGQLNYNQYFDNKHEVSAILGTELSQTHTVSNSGRTYGYDDEILTYTGVDVVNPYPIYGSLSSNSYVQSPSSFGDQLNRVVSFYGNMGYTFDKRYSISGSARRDASNLFGAKTNDKWRPLWSAGTAWNISNEKFYKLNWLPYLKARFTYGYSGNTNTGITQPVILYVQTPAINTNLRYAQVTFPPNPDLRWEKTRMINYGIDFSLKNNRLSGSLEYFSKNCTDLLSNSPIDPTTGFGAALINTATIKGKGYDIQLTSKNITGAFQWSSTISLSYVKDIVSKYYGNLSNASFYTGNTFAVSPIEGHVLYPIFSYKFAGLDPQTGNPTGYYKGNTSNSYSSILGDSVQNLKYNGSGIPLYTGFLMNNFSWKQWSLSFNITYKFKYYFHRETINYYQLFNSWSTHSDYSKRWQKPGDEKITNIPSMFYPANSSRDAFFAGSEATVEKGDHIRLQDIRVSYNWVNVQGKSSLIKNILLYIYANNIGILWRANKAERDPDYLSGLPAQKSIAVGLKADF